jgi:hypothetical protein
MKYVPTLEQLKAEAALLRHSRGIKPTHAHELVAQSYGYNSYNHYLQDVKHEKIQT